MSKFIRCSICGDLVDYDKGGTIAIKKRGYSTRYYCPRCIANTKYESEEKQNEHIKSKEN